MDLAQQTQDTKRQLEIDHLKSKQQLEAEWNNRHLVSVSLPFPSSYPFFD